MSTEISINRMYRDGTWEHTLTVRTGDADLFGALVKVVEMATSEAPAEEPVTVSAPEARTEPVDCGGVVMPPPQEMSEDEIDAINRRIAAVMNAELPATEPAPKKTGPVVALRLARKFSGKGTKQVAFDLGVSQSTILLWEREPERVPAFRREGLAKCLGYDVDEIRWTA